MPITANHKDVQILIQKYHDMLADLPSAINTYIKTAQILKLDASPYKGLEKDRALHQSNLSQVLQDFKLNTSISNDDLSDYMQVLTAVSQFIIDAGKVLNESPLLPKKNPALK